MKSIYRKYRPKSFKDVIGQDHVVKTLENQIKQNRVSHAYLFCGTRGTGKTSVAKIFAGMLTSPLDIFEIDAASNNSVTDIRDIIEKVKYPPVTGKYKVYIIDEVHMFSQSAFNAFLKTLEEPPPHVIFILCTTEQQKLLPTIQSRCLRFDFRSVSDENLYKIISDNLKQEKLTATDKAVKLIASSSGGSVRDAQSFLETVINFCGTREITENDVTVVLGTVGEDVLKKLLESIIKKDTKTIQSTCDTIFKNGISTNMLLKNFLDIIKTEFVKAPKEYARIFELFSELELTIKNSTDTRAHFENTCLLAVI